MVSISRAIRMGEDEWMCVIRPNRPPTCYQKIASPSLLISTNKHQWNDPSYIGCIPVCIGLLLCSLWLCSCDWPLHFWIIYYCLSLFVPSHASTFFWLRFLIADLLTEWTLLWFFSTWFCCWWRSFYFVENDVTEQCWFLLYRTYSHLIHIFMIIRCVFSNVNQFNTTDVTYSV